MKVLRIEYLGKDSTGCDTYKAITAKKVYTFSSGTIPLHEGPYELTVTRNKYSSYVFVSIKRTGTHWIRRASFIDKKDLTLEALL